MRNSLFAVLLFAGAAQAQHYDISVRIERGELHGRAFVSSANQKTAEVTWQRSVPANPQGFFLPSSSGWYPAKEGELASYSVTLELPAGQVGLVPGRLVEESTSAGRYRARFEFPQPSPGIDLMVGPYKITERDARSAAGRPIRLRTYFHPEIAALADGYLESVTGYIALYEKWIGDYPFSEFSVVSSPTPTGYGMAGLTYLGIEVLKLPFIRATSLGHEVLHNWWGNGVYPDYASGNWSEGLTTFMADYAYKEREGAEAAREMRLAWLRDLAALPPGEDFPLRAFVGRTHSASQIVGYRKSAMLFLMLRDALGEDAFDAALRAFWKEHRFRVAGWDDLRRAFERASGRSLEKFFAQWLERPGLPEVRITDAAAVETPTGWRAGGAVSSGGYELAVPLLLSTETGFQRVVADPTFAVEAASRPLELLLDPEARVLRRLAPGEAPPILRNLVVSPALRVVLLLAEGRKLAEALAEHPFRTTPTPDKEPLLVIGLHAEVDAWLARHALPARPYALEGKGTAQVWTVARPDAAPLGVVSARDAQSLEALLRPLPHYGGQSFIVFDGPKALERGVWPSQPQAWKF